MRMLCIRYTRSCNGSLIVDMKATKKQQLRPVG